MTDYYIGKKFYFNPDDEVSLKYYEGTADYCNNNNAMITEIGTVDVEVDQKKYTAEGEVTEKVTKTLRQFEIQAIPEPTEKELLQREMSELKAYLSETDYIITKLNELKLEDEEEYETAKETYSEQLTKRKEARTRINEIEAKIAELDAE